MGDTFQYFRRLEPREAAKLAARDLGRQLLQGQIDNRLDHANALVREFIFGLRPGDTMVNPITELCILEALCNFFQQETRSLLTRRLFSFLATCNVEDERKMSVLLKLVSLSISMGIKSVLDSCGNFLQETGPASSFARALALDLHNDFCMLCCQEPNPILDLPKLSAQFASSFAIAYLSCINDGQLELNEWSERFVSALRGWLHERPTLCTWSEAGSTSGGATTRTPHTLVPPLCLLTCLTSLESSRVELYSALHLQLLTALSRAPAARGAVLPLQVLHAATERAAALQGPSRRQSAARLLQTIHVASAGGGLSAANVQLLQITERLQDVWKHS